MTEARIEQALTDGIRKEGGWCIKLVSPGNAGVPDRLVLLPGGKVIFVELKTDTGRPSMLQRYVIKRLMKLGMDVRILYGIKAVRAFLQEVSIDAVQAIPVSGSSGAVDPGA